MIMYKCKKCEEMDEHYHEIFKVVETSINQQTDEITEICKNCKEENSCVIIMIDYTNVDPF